MGQALKLALGITLAVTVAGCSRDPHANAAKANAGHHGGGSPGTDKTSAELAFLFPDGNHRGWMESAGHQHGGEPEVPLAKLPADVRKKLIHQLSLTSQLIDRFATVEAAEAAGYRRAGPFKPGTGVHYMGGVNERSNTMTDQAILRPSALIYAGTSPDSPLAGFMYVQGDGSLDAPEPEGFPGPNDRWHRHKGLCNIHRPNGELVTVGNEGEVSEADCSAKGGRFEKGTSYMVHVWTVPAYTNPIGVFAHRNPAITCADGTYHVDKTKVENRCRG